MDIQPIINKSKGLFHPLKDIEYFKKVKSDGITLVWPNGLDLCPDVLYEMGEEVIDSKKSRSKKRKDANSQATKRRIHMVVKTKRD